MKKLSKLLVLLLSLVMIVSLFAGCKPADTDPSDDDGSNPSQNAPSVVFPLEQPVTFKMGVRGEKDYQELMEKCEWYKYLCEKTNVFIECVVLGSDAVGKLNTLITNGTPPDVVLGPITLSSSDVVDLGSQGRLLSLNKYLEDKTLMPNYQRLLEAVPEALKKMTAPDGNIWSLAYPA